MIRKHLQEHDELFWHMLEIQPRRPCTLLNVDAHSDMSMFDGQLGIGNFISKMAEMGWVNEVIWLRDPRSIDFQDGIYSFCFGRKNHASLEMACGMEEPFYFFQNAYVPVDRLVGPKNLLLTVASAPEKIPVSFDKTWVLSVDFDYFACANPGAEYLEGGVARYGADLLRRLYQEGRKIKNKQQWDHFMERANAAAPGIAETAVKSFYPDYSDTDQEIKEKILRLNRVISERFDLAKCIGVFGISSLSSGFAKAGKHDFISKCADQWFELLMRQINKAQKEGLSNEHTKLVAPRG